MIPGREPSAKTMFLCRFAFFSEGLRTRLHVFPLFLSLTFPPPLRSAPFLRPISQSRLLSLFSFVPSSFSTVSRCVLFITLPLATKLLPFGLHQESFFSFSSFFSSFFARCSHFFPAFPLLSRVQLHLPRRLNRIYEVNFVQSSLCTGNATFR